MFPAETQEFLVDSFDNPPTLKKEENVEDDTARKGKWKTNDMSKVETSERSGFQPIQPEAPGRNGQLGVDDSTEPAEDDDGSYVEYTDDVTCLVIVNDYLSALANCIGPYLRSFCTTHLTFLISGLQHC